MVNVNHASYKLTSHSSSILIVFLRDLLQPIGSYLAFRGIRFWLDNARGQIQSYRSIHQTIRLYERSQPRCCQSGWLGMFRSMSRIWMWILTRCWLCTKQQMESLPAFFLFFLPEIFDQYHDPKKKKKEAAITCLKLGNKKAGSPFVSVHAVQIRGIVFRSTFAKLSRAPQ